METFYFGPSGAPLFGVYHPPVYGQTRNLGILLCCPIGQEYVMSHRAFRRLSIRLADAGFHAMRFDYFGCGDSAGDCLEGHPERWLRDIAAAVGELRLRSGCSQVCLVGCRLGGALCVQTGVARGDIDLMVLWDPVVNGAAYLEELAQRHESMLRQSHVKADKRASGEPDREFLGFALSAAAAGSIQQIDLTRLSQRPAERLLVVESGASRPVDTLKRRLSDLGTQVEHRSIPTPNAWAWIEDISTTLVPQQVLNSITSWLCEARA